MLQVEAYDELGNPVSFPAVRVVVRNKSGAVLALAYELVTDVVYVAHLQDKDFPQLLQSLGVNLTEIPQTEVMRVP